MERSRFGASVFLFLSFMFLCLSLSYGPKGLWPDGQSSGFWLITKRWLNAIYLKRVFDLQTSMFKLTEDKVEKWSDEEKCKLHRNTNINCICLFNNIGKSKVQYEKLLFTSKKELENRNFFLSSKKITKVVETWLAWQLSSFIIIRLTIIHARICRLD